MHMNQYEHIIDGALVQKRCNAYIFNSDGLVENSYQGLPSNIFLTQECFYGQGFRHHEPEQRNLPHMVLLFEKLNFLSPYEMVCLRRKDVRIFIL